MFLITSSVFFSFKPFITQLKLTILEKITYISAFFVTSSSLSLILILKPLYITIININIIRYLSNNTKELLNLFLCLFNVKKTY
jgi:hypothetical protein